MIILCFWIKRKCVSTIYTLSGYNERLSSRVRVHPWNPTNIAVFIGCQLDTQTDADPDIRLDIPTQIHYAML